MKITCIDREVKKIFETGYYYIPRFQRPYSWEKDHIIDFWNDINNGSDADYFIGSIVVYKKSTETFGIVDGQQRLTTITMMLCALRDFYRSEGFENPAKGIHSLIEKIDLNNKQQYILQTETSYPYFQEHIQKYEEPEIGVDFGTEEVNLKKGFEIIEKSIQDEIDLLKRDKQKKENIREYTLKKLNEIRDNILRLKLIYIELDDEDDAYEIFETLNTRGKDLSVGDLVKNYLTKHIKANNTGVDIPKDKWNLIRDKIEGVDSDLDIDTFLLHVWLSKYEYTTGKTLFKKIKNQIRPAHSRAFLDNLVTDSVSYISIFDTETRKWDKNEYAIRDSLKTLSRFNVTQQTPMVLALMREYGAKKIKMKLVQEALEAIEHFHYIFTAITSQRSSGGIGTMYSTYGRKLSAASDDNLRSQIIKELKQKMREKLPTYDEFLASFRNIKFVKDFTKQKRIIQYTLSKIDKHYNDSGTTIDYETMTLEHILPQNPKVKGHVNSEHVGLLGNLILISEATNNAMANDDFAIKKKILLSSNIFIDQIISSSTEWTDREIDQRTELLAKNAYNTVFKI
jgi:uncharacterized protein with ParB-like and HNH nuclease domain